MIDILCPICECELECRQGTGRLYCCDCERYWTLPEIAMVQSQRDIDTGRTVMVMECRCDTGPVEACPLHGIAASNARQNDYWRRVGGHD